MTSAPENFVASHWGGRAPLWSAFWVLAMFGWSLVFYATLALAWQLPQSDRVRVAVLAATVVPYSVFAYTCVWRCSDNVRNHFWSEAARAYVVLTAVALVGGFAARLLSKA